MANKDTEVVIAKVKERTGYDVVVTPKPDMNTHASMLTAGKASPVHSIFLNPDYEHVADYLVAMQCAMILIKWDDPDGLFDFGCRLADQRYLFEKCENELLSKGIAGPQAKGFIDMITKGLVLQLASMPMQIMAADWCRHNCPNLQEQQTTSILREIRENSSTLSPQFRSLTPAIIFDRSAQMNAAMAYWWSNLNEATQATLPYKAQGFLDTGVSLCRLLRLDSQAEARPTYREAVDSWAKVLKMEKWYEWVPHQL